MCFSSGMHWKYSLASVWWWWKVDTCVMVLPSHSCISEIHPTTQPSSTHMHLHTHEHRDSYMYSKMQAQASIKVSTGGLKRVHKQHLETYSAQIGCLSLWKPVIALGTVEGRLFMRVNCERKWSICDDDFERKSHVLSFPRPQTLVTHRWLVALHEFFVAPGTFPQQRAKTFDTAAILCDDRAKTATIAPYPAKHYTSCWEETEWPPLGVLEAFSFERTFRTVTLI